MSDFHQAKMEEGQETYNDVLWIQVKLYIIFRFSKTNSIYLYLDYLLLLYFQVLWYPLFFTSNIC